MARKKNQQIRLGKLEKKEIRKLNAALKKYRIFPENIKLDETQINNKLRDHLRQAHIGLKAKSNAIPSPILVGETFRADIYGKSNNNKPLWCIECKKLVEKFAKSRLKEGLSQSVAYTTKFKVAFLVLYDFTKKRKYRRAFGAGNSLESTLAKRLREQMRIYLVVISPNHEL